MAPKAVGVTGNLSSLANYSTTGPTRLAADAIFNTHADASAHLHIGWVGDRFTDVHLPLAGVCATQHNYLKGMAIFTGLVLFVLSFVIFGTSQQSLSGLSAACCMCRRRITAEELTGSISARSPPMRGRRLSVRNPIPVDSGGETLPPLEKKTRADRIQGQWALFGLYLLIVVLVVLSFGSIPIYAAGGQRNDTIWRKACDENNVQLLHQMGLS